MNTIELYCSLLERDSIPYQNVRSRQRVAIAITPNRFSVLKVRRVGIGRPSMVDCPTYLAVADVGNGSCAFDLCLDGQVRFSHLEPVAQLHHLEYMMPGTVAQLGVLSHINKRGYWVPLSADSVIKPISRLEMHSLRGLCP